MPSAPTPPTGLEKLPATPTGLTAEPPEKAVLQQLLQMLTAQKDSLPEPVQALLSQQARQDTEDQAKLLHRQVSAQAKATRELQKVRESRAAYLTAWSNYMAQLTDLVAQQSQEQEETLRKLDEQEQLWGDRLRDSTTTLTRLTQDGGHQKDNDMEIEDNEKKVDDAIQLFSRNQN